MPASRRALPFVLIASSWATSAFGQGTICYSVQPGDTAARLAQRLTGSADARHLPGFQILDPATSMFVPKSRYDRIRSGWRVCVAAGMLSPRAGPVHVFPPVPLAPAGRPLSLDVRVLWWEIPLLVAVSGLVLVVTWNQIQHRRASLEIMSRFSGRFIQEFERPLFHRTPDPVVKSRLRLAPRSRRLDILLAPANGRTYPNLVDHKRNVEYDVERVLQLLNDEPFVHGPLHAEGRWVVIPFHFEPNRQQEGVS